MFLSKVEKLDLLNRTNNTGWREYLLAEHKFWVSLCASLGWGGLPLKWKELEERIYILHGNLFQDKTLWSCYYYLINIARDMHMYFFSTLIWHLLLFRTKKRRAGKLPPRHLRLNWNLLRVIAYVLKLKLQKWEVYLHPLFSFYQITHICEVNVHAFLIGQVSWNLMCLRKPRS